MSSLSSCNCPYRHRICVTLSQSITNTELPHSIRTEGQVLSSPIVCLNFSLKHCVKILVLLERRETTIWHRFHRDIGERQCHLEVQAFENSQQMHETLCKELSALGLCSCCFSKVTTKIHDYYSRNKTYMVDSENRDNNIVFSLDIGILKHRQLRHYERCINETSVRVARRYGMVPTTVSAFQNLLRKVTIKSRSTELNGIAEETSGSIYLNEGETCSICLNEFRVKDMARMMPCSHAFHLICIRKWLLRSRYCPLCRYQMPPAVERPLGV